jgi:4-amino-4-deoxy-L-arabinose transferase-like glycosyltransferase
VNKKHIISLLCITIVALFLRVFQVSVNPPALNWDEVSIGYNAYSILKTGSDEHGRFLPIDSFIGYGDYKPPLAVYITVPFVAVFGLNELSVRLPSVLFGTAIVTLLYFLVVELLHNKRLGLWASFFIAISPWHINISRAGFEANIGLFFIVLGACFVLWARERPRLWLVSWLPFVAAIYTFNSSRYFAPFLAVGLCVYMWREIKKHSRLVISGMCIAVLFLLPIVPHLLSAEARLRFVEVNIFSDSRIVTDANEAISRESNTWDAKALHNRRIGYAQSFLSHYFDHFSPDFLFIKGDGNPKFSTQDVGQLYLMDLPFLIIGIYVAFVAWPTQALLLVYWLLTAIIPAAVARETPHALRILNSLPVWHVFIAIGVVTVLARVSRFRKILFICVVAGYIVSAAYYLHNYYLHYPRIYSNEWQYGYKQALLVANKPENREKTVYLSEYIGRAYMYTAFYMQFDPTKFQKMKKSYFDAAGFYHVDGFDRYVFGDTPPLDLAPNTLYIYPPGLVPQGAVVRETITLLNGIPVLVVFEKE